MRQTFIISGLLVGLLTFMVTPHASASIINGDQFGIAMNLAPADNSSFENVNATVTSTFADGATVNLGVSTFNPNVTMQLQMTEQIVTPRNSIITIDIFGVDASNNFASPLSLGSVAQNGNPFTVAYLDLGVFNGAPNGPGDRLDFAAPSYVVNSSFFGMINSAGEVAGSGGLGPSSTSPDGYSDFAGFTIGSDIENTGLGDVFGPNFFPTTNAVLVGWTVELDVTVIPEPSSFAVLGGLSIGALVYRRRRRSATTVTAA